jgi:hypothetical protein
MRGFHNNFTEYGTVEMRAYLFGMRLPTLLLGVIAVHFVLTR